MSPGDLRELARELRAMVKPSADYYDVGQLVWQLPADAAEPLLRGAADTLERLAAEQEAAQAASSEPGEAALRDVSEPAVGRTPATRPGSLGAEADEALIRHALESAFGDWEAALAALDRLLAGKAAG